MKMRTGAERSTRLGHFPGATRRPELAGFFQLWTTGQISSVVELGSAGDRSGAWLSSKALRPGAPSGLLAAISNVTSGSVEPSKSLGTF